MEFKEPYRRVTYCKELRIDPELSLGSGPGPNTLIDSFLIIFIIKKCQKSENVEFKEP
jgi:hypothetical protein